MQFVPTALEVTQQVATQASYLLKPEVITAIVSLIGGGVAAWWGYMKSRATSADKQRDQFYQTILEDSKLLRSECLDLRKMIGELQNEVQVLRNKLIFYEENHLASEARQMLSFVMNEDDRPAWIHAVGENKWYLNDAYCREFNVIRRSFWTPVNIFARYDDEDSLRYTHNDIQVIEAGTTLEFFERVRTRITDPDCQDLAYGVFRKSPLIIGENKYVVGHLVGELTADDGQGDGKKILD